VSAHGILAEASDSVAAVARPTALPPNRNVAQAEVLLEALVTAGVREMCLCPGSRSTPLAVAAAAVPALRVRVHMDERAAAFFALGLAKATRSAVALVCTSGTAAANFLPAVVEASFARVPLVVLTADRPPELRDWGAPQTIDQVRLFGSHVRWFAELPVPEPTRALLHHARAVGARAVAVALEDPRGPVHLNLPYREPLEPVRIESDVDALAGHDPGTLPTQPRVIAPRPVPPATLVERLAAEIRHVRRGVLAVGPQDDDPALPEALARLARAACWPLLADGASQLRTGPYAAEAPVCGAYDAILRHEPFAAAHVPQLALRFGPPLTSQAANRWLERSPETELRLIDPAAAFLDPSHRAAEVLCIDPVAFCHAVAERLEARPPVGIGTWLDSLLAAERVAQSALAAALGAEPTLYAPAVVRALAEALPDGAALFVSNSMPIRDVDGFLAPGPRQLRVLSNRGANGIDGIASSALGAAAGIDGPVALLTGDLAFLHDVGGLLAAKRYGLSLVCVVVNDDGGGIFSYLPIAEFGEAVHFEERFTAPHGVDLARVTALAEGVHMRVRRPGELALALKQSVGAHGLRVIELAILRDAQVAHHRVLWDAVAQAFGSLHRAWGAA